MHKLHKQDNLKFIFQIYFQKYFTIKLDSRKYVMNYCCNSLEHTEFDSARDVIYEKAVGYLAKVRT